MKNDSLYHLDILKTCFFLSGCLLVLISQRSYASVSTAQLDTHLTATTLPMISNNDR